MYQHLSRAPHKDKQHTHMFEFSEREWSRLSTNVQQKLVIVKDLPDTNLAVPHLNVERQLTDTNSNALAVQGALYNVAKPKSYK